MANAQQICNEITDFSINAGRTRRRTTTTTTLANARNHHVHAGWRALFRGVSSLSDRHPTSAIRVKVVLSGRSRAASTRISNSGYVSLELRYTARVPARSRRGDATRLPLALVLLDALFLATIAFPVLAEGRRSTINLARRSLPFPFSVLGPFFSPSNRARARRSL